MALKRLVRTVALVGVAVLAAAVLVGCSTTTKPTAVDVSAGDAGSGNFSFTGAPASFKGGLDDLTLRNASKSEVHDMQLVRITGNHTFGEFQKQVLDSLGGPIPNWIGVGGGVGLVTPGHTLTSHLNLPPGKYLYFCDEGLGDGAHYKHGMKGAFTVTGKQSTKALPTAAATVKAHEYTFDIQGLHAGRQTLRFENTGAQLHHMILAPIAAGKTFADVQAAFGKPPLQNSGPPPIEFLKATQEPVLDSGRALVTTIDLKAGDYAMLCFINDRAGGPPHAVKGMLKEVKIS